MREIQIYWVIYYFVFVASFVVFLVLHWSSFTADSWIYLLAAICGAAVGIGLLAVALVESVGRMVLLVPEIIKKLREQGREEGRTEGREEGRIEGREKERKEQRRRREEAYMRFGVEVEDGVLTLPNTLEVEAFLSGETEEQS